MGLFTSDKVKSKKLKEEGCLVTLSVEIPPVEVENETQNLLVRIQQRAKVPGFRPGKAPMEVVKKHFTDHAKGEVLDSLIRKHVPEALRELNVRPVATPAVEDVKWDEGKAVKLQIRAEIAPMVSPKDYAKIPIKKKSYAVTDEQLDARISELRDANARLEKANDEGVAKNHYVVIDYAGFQNGKAMAGAKGQNELVDMSSEQTVEGLVEGLVGLKREESKDIAVKLGGKDAVLKVTIKEIKHKILPEVDAEFAKDMGFESVDLLKKKMREVMEDEAKSKTEQEVSKQIEEALLKSNKIPLPPSMVEAQLEHLIERVKRQIAGPRGELSEEQLKDLREKLKSRAEDELRISYLLPAIAEKEKLQALDSDLQAELDKNLNAVEAADKKEEVRRFFNERKESIAGMIRDRKAMAFIRDKAVITEA